MKKIFIIILAVLTIPNVTGQKLTETDHMRYWYYRHRINTEFIRHGLEQNLCDGSGLSLPAVGAVHYRTGTKLGLSWIDNPVQFLGRYIGVLATELALLYEHGQPYDSTQKELYYAMKAYARIDYNCECIFYPDEFGDIGQKNGLFCRDDVPWNFIQSASDSAWCDSNWYSYNVMSHYKSYFDKYKGTDYEDSALFKTYYASGEEWQGMQTGFALLVYALKDCPSEVVIYNGYRFIEEAILHTQRYMDYLIEDGWVGRLSNDKMYKYGADGLKFHALYGMAKAADFICDPDRDYRVPLTFTPKGDYSDIFDYHNPLFDPALPLFLVDFGIVMGADEIAKYWLYGEYTGNFLFRYQKYFWLKLGNPHWEIGNIEDFGILFNNVNINQDSLLLTVNYLIGSETYTYKGKRHIVSSPYSWAAIGDSWTIDHNDPQDMTFETLCTYTDDVNWDFFPLLNHYLHNKNKAGAGYVRQKIVNHLITAPCAGPHYLPHFSKFKSEGTEGWRSGYKWDSNYNDAMYGPDTTNTETNWVGGKSNGLDYMIAYNLLWLDCLQRNEKDHYLDISLYDNGRDADYDVLTNEEVSVVFKHGGTVHKTEWEPGYRGAYPRDAIITGETVLITGEHNFGDGHTLEIIPDHKVTQCEIEQYLEN